jgi:hypothetical protein
LRISTIAAQEMLYDAREDELGKALEGSGWSYTKTGITKLAPLILSAGNKLYFSPYLERFTETQKGKMFSFKDNNGNDNYLIRLTQDNGNIYSECSFRKYG